MNLLRILTVARSLGTLLIPILTTQTIQTVTSQAGQTPFLFPTDNQGLITDQSPSDFFVGTPGKPWTSGTYGCVRSSGYQFHEGADIRPLKRDKRNEPLDVVRSTANGWIVYLNKKAGLSNYGKYVVIGHKIEGLEVYSLYAHLKSVATPLTLGKWVNAGDEVGILGRTSNTRQRISRERAHLHFEIALLVNHRYPEYFRSKFPKGTNDHGIWNGQNLLGLDPTEIFKAQATAESFQLRDYLRTRESLFRVNVFTPDFPWLQRYLPLILKADELVLEEIGGYEIAFDFSGLPFQLKPISKPAETEGTPWELVEVNETLYQEYPCRKLVVKTGAKWRLTAKGRQLIELLIFNP